MQVLDGPLPVTRLHQCCYARWKTGCFWKGMERPHSLSQIPFFESSSLSAEEVRYVFPKQGEWSFQANWPTQVSQHVMTSSKVHRWIMEIVYMLAYEHLCNCAHGLLRIVNNIEEGLKDNALLRNSARKPNCYLAVPQSHVGVRHLHWWSLPSSCLLCHLGRAQPENADLACAKSKWDLGWAT